MLLGRAPFKAEVLALTPPSRCCLIHAIMEFVHADVEAVHAIVDVDVLVPPAAVLGGPLRGLLLWPFVVFYILFPLCELRYRGTSRPGTQASAESSQSDSSTMLNPITSYNVTASVNGEQGIAELVDGVKGSLASGG